MDGAKHILSFVKDPKSSLFVKVIVGIPPGDDLYFLHRAVLSRRSRFFGVALKPGFKEGRTGVVKLPEIEPVVFDAIVRWLYKAGFDAFDYDNITHLMLIYDAADYLQLIEFRVDFLEEIVKAFKPYLASEKYIPNCMFTQPLRLISRILTRSLSESESSLIGEIVRDIILTRIKCREEKNNIEYRDTFGLEELSLHEQVSILRLLYSTSEDLLIKKVHEAENLKASSANTNV